MDAKPFLVLDFSALDETLLPELAKLTKESFDLDSVINAAGELKYISRLKRVLASQFKEPEDDWGAGSDNPCVRGVFQVNDRLKNALGGPDAYVSVSKDAVEAKPARDEEPGSEVVTTEEEIEGYRVVRAIVCSEVPISRVVARDAKTYCSVLLDDNNRKPIARLWLNRAKKYLGVFDENKVETRIAIDDVAEIYQHADQLRRTVARYLARTAQGDADETAIPEGPVLTG